MLYMHTAEPLKMLLPKPDTEKESVYSFNVIIRQDKIFGQLKPFSMEKRALHWLPGGRENSVDDWVLGILGAHEENILCKS